MIKIGDKFRWISVDWNHIVQVISIESLATNTCYTTYTYLVNDRLPNCVGSYYSLYIDEDLITILHWPEYLKNNDTN